jgi:tetratricopeptide (TPR) repeat protein
MHEKPMSALDLAQLLRQVRQGLQDNNYPAAIQGFEGLARLAHADEDYAAEGRHLGNLALLYYRIGNLRQALHCFDRALECARADQDRLTEAGLLGNVGNILREAKRYDQAMEYLNAALLIAQEQGDDRGRGIWLANLALVYDDLGQHDRALPLHENAVSLARQLNDQRGLAGRLGNLGNSALAAGETTRALAAFEEAILLLRDLGDDKGLAQRLGVLGNLYARLARADGMSPDEARVWFAYALTAYRETLALAARLGDADSTADLLQAMGGVAADMGDAVHALRYYDAASRAYFAAQDSDPAAALSSIIASIA